MEWLQLVFRWIHVVAGIMWIGHLYFFNWVNAHVAKTYDADSRRKVVPELMPRALYWFRWGAAYTWITGILLAGLVYYMDKTGMVPLAADAASRTRLPWAPENSVAAMGIGLGLLVVAFLVYDQLWKQMAQQEMVAFGISFVLLAGLCFALCRTFVGRAAYIHVGMMLGTLMAGNVWMRIWPAQKKIIAAIRDGNAPDGALVGRATLRSKHNTYMSVPLVMIMLSNHYPIITYSHDQAWLILVGVCAVGFIACKLLFLKAASPAPRAF